MDTSLIYAKFFELFFGKDTMGNTLVVLCQNNQPPKEIDIVTYVLSVVLTHKIEIQLTNTGLQLFSGKDVTYPYQHMNASQRDFLLELLGLYSDEWIYYEDSLLWRHRVASETHMDRGKVLCCMCRLVFQSKLYKDNRSKLTIANIILQRVNACVCIHKSVQKELNEFLYSLPEIGSEYKKPIVNENKEDAGHSAIESGSGEEWETGEL